MKCHPVSDPPPHSPYQWAPPGAARPRWQLLTKRSFLFVFKLH